MSVFAINAPLPARAVISTAWSILLYCTEHAVGSIKSLTQIFRGKRYVEKVACPRLFGIQGLAEKPVGWKLVKKKIKGASQPFQTLSFLNFGFGYL